MASDKTVTFPVTEQRTRPREKPRLDPASREGSQDAQRRRRAWGALIGLWAALGVLGAWIINDVLSGYREADTRVRSQAQVYAKMVASHDRFELEMADQIIKSLLVHMDDSLFNGQVPDARRAAFEALLAEHRARLPGIASFTVVGEDGIRRFGVVGKNFTDLSERGYYKALKAGQDSFVSPAESGLASGKAGIHVARAFRRADGSFGGLVVINLAVQDIFRPYYASLGLEGARVQLRSADRVLIAYPASDELAPMAPLADALTPLLAQGQERGIVDDGEWVSAFERLQSSSVYAEASLSRALFHHEPDRAALLALSALFAAVLAGAALTRAIAGGLRAHTELAVAYIDQRQMTVRDKLTGLHNRHYIDDQFVESRDAAVARGHSLALIFVDLDRFKAVNDGLGHQAGDVLLREVARRLRMAGGDESTVVRLGGDEFVLLVDLGPAGDDEVVRVSAICQRILDIFGPVFDLPGGPVPGSASVGVARMPADGVEWDDLAHKADVAMYYSKRTGRSRYTVYHADLEASLDMPG